MSEPGNGDVLDVALRVAAAIEACGGEYFVGGSVASSLQGEPRATNDIDFVLSLPLGKIFVPNAVALHSNGDSHSTAEPDLRAKARETLGVSAAADRVEVLERSA